MSEVHYIISDTIEFLDSLDGSNFFDLVYCDPPYNLEYFKSDKGATLQTQYLMKMHQGQYLDWMHGLLKKLGKMMKPGAHLYLFCTDWNIPPLWRILDIDYWLEPHSLLTWHKPNMANVERAVHDFLPDREFIIFASKGKARRLNDIGVAESRHSVWNISTPVFSERKMKELKIHPNQKPIELCRRIVRYSSQEKELVFDPFSGSGVMLLACKQLNRDCIGIDIDGQWQEYYTEQAEKTTSILEYAE